ncbi:dermonecrotic toxin domain-containing protein [Pseudomonas sp. 2835]|uniref:dermonecrotic toxin domain-containing protein n=1 Tax=Pseudomonas sp. 2835 TaxID=3156451 RepID=UPI003D1D4E8B
MSDTADTSTVIYHYKRLAEGLRPRLEHFNRDNLQALLHSQRAIHTDRQAQPHAWFNDSEPEQRTALLKAAKAQEDARWRLAGSLSALQSITEYATPLLTRALLEQHGLQLDVTRAQLHRWASETIGGRQVIKGPERRASLLEAALQNFEAFEDFHFSHLTRDGQATDTLALTAKDFAALCRDLDLGLGYQQHLEQVFDQSGNAQQLREQMSEATRTDVQLLVQRARIKSEISDSAHDMLQALLKGAPAMLDGKPVVCRRLAIFDCELADVLLIGPPTAGSDSTERCVAWIAGAPLAPLKEYSSTSAFAKDLAISLQTTEYSRALAAKVPQALKGQFIRRLESTLFEVRFQGNEQIRQPIAQPRLQVSERIVEGELWSRLQALQVRRLKANSRVLAVPTGDEDYQARLQRLDSWLEIALDVLNAAAFVVPGLNEVMLAVTGAQLMGNLFHGVQAWEAHETAEAVAQLESLALNLGLFAGLAAAGVALQPSAFVDRMHSVELADGQTRLWKADLSGYANQVQIPDSVQANDLGQYLHEGRYYLRLNEHWYEQRQTDSGQWCLVHPTDPQAYEPVLRHNGQGAWQFQGEQPLHWPRGQLLRRIGALADGLDDAQLERALRISGVDEQALRSAHVDQAPIPALLADTLQRMQLERRITRLISDVRAGMMPQPGMTYPVALLVELPNWPANRVLEVYDGPELWGASSTYGLERWPQGRSIKLLASEVRQGQLPEKVLAALGEDEISQLLGSNVATAARTQVLRNTLAEQVQKHRGAIFDRLRQSAPGPSSPGVALLLRDFPELPERIAREIESQASLVEQAQLNQAGARLPLRLAEEARLYQREVRLSHALEGLQVSAPNNPDSQRLALGGLESLPGWTGNVRIELREEVVSGRLLASIGRADGELKTLVANSERYRAYDGLGNELASGDDFFAAILRALPDAERQALSMDIFDAGQLRLRLQELALEDRPRASHLLGQQPRKPWHRAPLRLADGRNGYTLGGASSTLRPETHRRLGVLYPEMSSKQITRLVGELRQSGRDLAEIVEALEKEYRQLQIKLDDWARSAPGSPTRQQVASRLKRAWQRGGGSQSHKLDLKELDITGLPTLDVQFPHITELDMRGVVGPYGVRGGEIPPHLFSRFPKLRALGLGGNFLPEIPSTISLCGELEELAMNSNRLHINDTMFQPLQALAKLKSFSLASNGLGQLPDAAVEALSQLPALAYLDLSSNQLVLETRHLEQLSRLSLGNLNLSHNRITLDEAGAAVFQRFINLRKLNLHSNPLMRAPDLSFMPMLDSVDLSFCQLREWPAGLTDLMNQNQFQLRSINLADNQIGQIPPLAQTRFGMILRRQGPLGDLALRLPNNPLDAQGILRLHALGLSHVFHGDITPNRLWLQGASEVRQELWQALFDNERNRSLFTALSTLERSQAAQIDAEHLTRRVWSMLELAAQEEVLRNDLNDIAGSFPDTCGDAGADVFAALEVEVMANRLAGQALDVQGRTGELLGLYQRLYRRHQVERIADRISSLRQLRKNALDSGEAPPALDPLDDISDADLAHTVDDIEVRLALRRTLASRLDFPEPSDGMLYRHLAYVSDRLASRVEREVRRLDIATSRQQWMLEQPGWTRFLKQRFKSQFDALTERWYEGTEYADHCLDLHNPPVAMLDAGVVSFLNGQAAEADFAGAGITSLSHDDAGALRRQAFNDHQYTVFLNVLARGQAAAERALLLRLTAMPG